MSRTGCLLVVSSIVAMGVAGASPAATATSTARRAKPRLTLLGFAVAPVPADRLGSIPPIPPSLTKDGGTITDCNGAVPRATPTGGKLAGLLIVTKLAGRADFVSGGMTGPNGPALLRFGRSSKPRTAVVQDSGRVRLIDRNGRYKVTAGVLVRTATGRLNRVQQLVALVTVSCPGA